MKKKPSRSALNLLRSLADGGKGSHRYGHSTYNEIINSKLASYGEQGWKLTDEGLRALEDSARRK